MQAFKTHPHEQKSHQNSHGKCLMICPFWNLKESNQLEMSSSMAQGKCGCHQFYSMQSLTQHLYRHLNPYSCQMCAENNQIRKLDSHFRFVNQRDLKAHYKKVHDKIGLRIYPIEINNVEAKVFIQQHFFRIDNELCMRLWKDGSSSKGGIRVLKIKVLQLAMKNGVWTAVLESGGDDGLDRE